MTPRWSIAVAGAGPAGLAAALSLDRSGHRVTLIERFVEPRPIGSGLMLQPTGMAVLGHLGLSGQVELLGQRIDRLFGRVTPSERVTLDVRYCHSDSRHSGLAVHRAALFEALFGAVRTSSVQLETGCDVAGVQRMSSDAVALLLADGTRMGPFDCVVDALGAWSPLAPLYRGAVRRELPYGALWTTLPWPGGPFSNTALEQRYAGSSVMVGVLPIGRRFPGDSEQTAFFWSIRPGDYAAWRSGGLAAWKDRVRRLWPATEPLLEAIAAADQMTLARYSHHTLAMPVSGRVVAVGDSAHAASPQLGQGANMALLDARALTVALDQMASLDQALERYAALRRWHVRYYQALSAIFTPFYQSDSTVLPVLRDWCVAPATRAPLVRNFVARNVAGLIADPRPRLGLHAA